MATLQTFGGGTTDFILDPGNGAKPLPNAPYTIIDGATMQPASGLVDASGVAVTQLSSDADGRYAGGALLEGPTYWLDAVGAKGSFRAGPQVSTTVLASVVDMAPRLDSIAASASASAFSAKQAQAAAEAVQTGAATKDASLLTAGTLDAARLPDLSGTYANVATAAAALSTAQTARYTGRASGGGPVTVGSVMVAGPSADAYNAFPGSALTADGTLLLVWRAGPTHTGGSDGRIYLSKSTDYGRTWSAPVLVRDETLDLRDPSITVSRDGSKWWITYFTYNTPAAPNLRSWVITSTDKGASWGAPVALSTGAYAISAPVVELADGSLVAPLYGQVNGKDASLVVSSTNGGASWSAPVTAAGSASVDFQEPYLLNTPSGLVMMCRYNNQDGIARVLRTGTTWGAPVRVFSGWGAPRTVRTSTGATICFYRDITTSGALMRVSRDNGATWGSSVTFDSDTKQMVYVAPVEVGPGIVSAIGGFEPVGTTSQSVLRVRHVLDGTGVSALADVAFTAPAATTIDPRIAVADGISAIVAADDFARADGTLGTPVYGPTWTAPNVTITGGVARPVTVNTMSTAILDVGGPDYEVEADIAWFNSSGPGLVVRYVDDSNLIWLTSETSGANCRLYKMVAGTTTQLATATAVQATTASGQWYRWGVSVKGNRINTYLDGALIHSVDITADANVATFSGKTKVGLRLNSPSTANYQACRRFVVRR